MHALVGADRQRPADVRQRLILAGRQRLLDQRDAGFGAFGEILFEIVRCPGLIGIDDEFGFGRRLAHRGDPLAVAVAAELDLEQRPVRGLGGRRGHRLRRSQRDRIGGGAGPRGRASEQFPDALAADLGLEVQQGAIQRVAGGAGRHRRLQGLSGRALAQAGPASTTGRPGWLPASRHSADRGRIRRVRYGRRGRLRATTVTASVLAPRLMVKLPAIGQRSIRAASVGDLLEVISKSGNF